MPNLNCQNVLITFIKSFIEFKQMHTDPNSRKQIKVNETVASDLLKKAQKFQKDFQKMQEEFNQSPETFYYIVSVKFIEQWKEFCLSSEPVRVAPNTMNFDLYEDGNLKRGLVQRADFQLVNAEIYALFKPFQDKTFSNRRESVFIGKQKRVPIQLPTFKYILTTLQILKSIDFDRLDVKDFKLQNIQISEESTLQHFITILKEKEKLPESSNARIWIPAKQLTPEQLRRQIRKQLKPCSLATYNIKGIGSRKDDLTAKISSLQLQDGVYIIVETKNQSDKFVFCKDNEDRCEGCNHFGELKYPCGCNDVKYCSEKCMEKDKVYHMRSCKYAEQMELNKPIDMTVQPKSQKGKVGLNNLGNTCFMNSCLQCLSHTMPLTNYFLKQHFQSEINKTNPIGTKGKLVKNYAKFIKGMWCDEEDSFSPYSVKNAVSDINPMFSGYAQHDSQQFFSFLVDGLHEDLNRIETKPYVQSVQQGNKSQTQLAKQSWIAHLKRNQSIITDLMSGQYRSIVTCPDCNHKSTTFDPFITVTLPIPQSTQSVSEFFFIHANMEKKNKRCWFKYTKKDSDQWNKKACESVGADLSKCCLYVVSLKENIYRVGRQPMNQIINKIQNESKNMFLIEFSQEELSIPKDDVVQFTVRISKTTYHSSDELFFKIPMLFDKNNLTGLTVYKRLLKFLYGQAYDTSKSKKTFGWGGKHYEEYEIQMLKQRPFKIILRIGKKVQKTYHRIDIQFRKQIQINEENSILQLLENQSIKVFDCEIDARFQKGKISEFTFQRLKDFDTNGKQPKVDRSESEVELDKCLQSFSTAEVLQAGNQWYCPKCKDHKLAKKQLSIYRSPKILILHLKRFKQKGAYKKQKNQSLVRFPSELNMKPYVINHESMFNYREQIEEQVYKHPKPEEKEKQILSLEYGKKADPTYQLYAISNHFGGLGGGHYTAYAKNNGEWYNFDDNHVSKTGKRDIVSSSAYLLFYERKQNSK